MKDWKDITLEQIQSMTEDELLATNRFRDNSLYAFVRQGDHALVECLLKKMPSIAKVNAHKDDAPLTLAIRKGNLDIVNALLVAGADVNANTKNANGHIDYTALMLAARNGSLDIVQALLSAGADVKAKSTYNYTALMFAINRCLKYSKSIECVEAVDLLLNKGASFTEDIKSFLYGKNISIPLAKVLAKHIEPGGLLSMDSDSKCCIFRGVTQENSKTYLQVDSRPGKFEY